ncbi:MAG: OadG-related small transporter subunit [Pygmaiobacter sp.]
MDFYAVNLSLQTMLLGMCGIFLVMSTISLAITALNAVFKK